MMHEATSAATLSGHVYINPPIIPMDGTNHGYVDLCATLKSMQAQLTSIETKLDALTRPGIKPEYEYQTSVPAIQRASNA